jgi:hypothetical protein
VSPALALWLVCLFVTAAAVRFIPAWWRRNRSIHVRTDEHRVMVNALADWLQQRRIVQAVLESGAYTQKDLQLTFECLPAMSEYQLKTAAQKMLTDRMTRRVIATYMEKAHGTDKSEIMKALLQWAGVAA